MEFDGFPPLGKGKVFSIFGYVSYAKFRILWLLFIPFFSYLKGTDADTLYENFAKPKIKVSFFGEKTCLKTHFQVLHNSISSFHSNFQVGSEWVTKGQNVEQVKNISFFK